MISAIVWIIIALSAGTILLAIWCCLAINTPRTEEGKRRAFQENCKAFDDYVAMKKGGKRSAD